MYCVCPAPCTLRCAAVRVAAFDLRRESADFAGKSAALRTLMHPATAEGGIVAKGHGDGHVDGVTGVCFSQGLPMSEAMNQLLLAYLPLIIFVGVSAVIALALLASAFLLAYKQPDPEKLSAYECGFNAFDDARMKFDVRFYLVAILFIIFDLEVTFLFPWAATFGQVGAFGFWAMMIFLAVLTIGFIYEWKKGALEWD
jgi:NADH-quinone oxidoreductase subunit A